MLKSKDKLQSEDVEVYDREGKILTPEIENLDANIDEKSHLDCKKQTFEYTQITEETKESSPGTTETVSPHSLIDTSPKGGDYQADQEDNQRFSPLAQLAIDDLVTLVEKRHMYASVQ